MTEPRGTLAGQDETQPKEMTMTTTTKLPQHLSSAYDWTNAAGELDELRGLEGDALSDYAKESAENWRENPSGDSVTEDDLIALAEWLRAQVPTTTKNLTEAQISKFRAEAATAADYEMIAICDLALTGKFDRDDYTTLSRLEADTIADMSRQDAYETIVDAINEAAAQHSAHGRLVDYNTTAIIRAATVEEQRASQEQAKRDGGAGVIDVDGRRCYVED